VGLTAAGVDVFRYCFVQFNSYFSAASAISSLNDADLQGRKVHVDWATPRTQNRTSSDNKDVDLPVERGGDKGTSEEGEETSSEQEIAAEGESDEDEEEKESSEEEEESGSDGDSGIGEDQAHEATASQSKLPLKKKKKHHDVAEGRTVFIRQVSLGRRGRKGGVGVCIQRCEHLVLRHLKKNLTLKAYQLLNTLCNVTIREGKCTYMC